MKRTTNECVDLLNDLLMALGPWKVEGALVVVSKARRDHMYWLAGGVHHLGPHHPTRLVFHLDMGPFKLGRWATTVIEVDARELQCDSERFVALVWSRIAGGILSLRALLERSRR